MYCNRKSRMIICLSVLAAMIFFPIHIFAQEKKKIVEHEAGFLLYHSKGRYSLGSFREIL